jgi:hypothetical protein
MEIVTNPYSNVITNEQDKEPIPSAVIDWSRIGKLPSSIDIKNLRFITTPTKGKLTQVNLGGKLLII